MFKPGQKVICIKDFPYFEPLKELILPKKGQIYTIRDSYIMKKTIKTCSLLEIQNYGRCLKNSEDGREHGFGQIMFRELTPDELLDIEIKEALVSDIPNKEVNNYQIKK